MRHVLAVAGYELEKESSTRLGALQAFYVDVPDDSPEKATLVELASEKSMSGVLDAKWSPLSRQSPATQAVIACANADGTASLTALGQISSDGAAAGFKHAPFTWTPLCSLAFGEEGSRPIVLSADWATVPADASPGVACQLAVSRRDGLVSVLSSEINAAAGTAALAEDDSWLAHRYTPSCGAEAWIVCVNPHCSPGSCREVFTGGDDCKLHGWDTRTPVQGPRRLRKPTSTVTMEAGVCSLQWHPSNPYVFASGGYDGAVRLWDTRRGCSSVEEAVAQTDTGGGVWRLKWGGEELLLGACMRGGAQVLNAEGLGTGAEGLRRLAQSLAHGAEALTYGADWVGLRLPGVGQLAVTCSFYNREARLWALPDATSRTAVPNS